MTLYNVIVILTLLFSGDALGLNYHYRSDPNASADLNCGEKLDEDCSANKLKHMTYVFNAFIFLQLFNQINCRKIGEGSVNVFDSILRNKYFLLVLSGEFFI
jgi:Ca2+-transporting ATPase